MKKLFKDSEGGEWERAPEIDEGKPALPGYQYATFRRRKVEKPPQGNEELAKRFYQGFAGQCCDIAGILNAVDAKIAAATEKLRADIDGETVYRQELVGRIIKLEARIAALEKNLADLALFGPLHLRSSST